VIEEAQDEALVEVGESERHRRPAGVHARVS
jgi:hypothetical protein